MHKLEVQIGHSALTIWRRFRLMRGVFSSVGLERLDTAIWGFAGFRRA